MNQQYEFVIHGHLTTQWSDMFDGMEVTSLPDGNTRITSSPLDQSALYGLLMRLRDFGLILVSLNSVETKEKK